MYVPSATELVEEKDECKELESAVETQDGIMAEMVHREW